MSEGKKSDYAPEDASDFLDERIDGLRDLFPEAFSEEKVDFDKLRAALGDEERTLVLMRLRAFRGER